MPFKLSKYQNYKPSGLDWLGEVPEVWEVKRLKELGSLQNGVSKGAEYFGSGSPFVSYGNIYNDTLELEKITTYAISTIEDQKLYSVREKDVFFTRTSETLEEIGFSSTCLKTIPKATFSGFVIRFRPYSNQLIKKFSNYYFQASIHRNFFVKEMNIVTRVSLNQGVLSNLPVILPDKQTQVTIANYLDKQTAKIDKEINLLSQKAQKYKQLKQTLISETVTKGLDKTAKLKPSGVDWIGDIPVGWALKRGKELFFENPKSKITASEGDSIGKYKFFTSSNEQSKWLDYFEMKKESILFSTGGKSGVNYCEQKYSYSTDTWSIYANKKIFLKFYAYYFESKIYEIHILGFRGAGLEHLQKDFIKQEFIPFPDHDTQKDIADYLDLQTGKIDRVISAINQKTDKLKEYRKVLINDVVVGKVRIVNDQL